MSSSEMDTQTTDSHIGNNVVLCGALLCRLSCHVHERRYSNISVSVGDHWEVNCNDLQQICGLCHSASISPVHHCANYMFVSCLSPHAFCVFLCLSFCRADNILQDFELIDGGFKNDSISILNLFSMCNIIKTGKKIKECLCHLYMARCMI